MDSKLSIAFFNKVNALDDREYLLSIIKFYAAPTLEGIKPASLICFTNNGRNMYNLWNKYGSEVNGLLGIHHFQIYRDTERALVLFYNIDSLEKTINSPDNKKFLKEIGYDKASNVLEYLKMLKYRYSWGFPHEIGIFLGIPCEDVKGFMQNSGSNYIMNGYWKVYSKPQRARKLFQEYDNLRTNAMISIMESLRDWVN